MDKIQLTSSSNNFQAPPNKSHASSKQNSLPSLSALLQTSQVKPITTSTKPRSPSREARKDERPYKRVPMEEELNQSSEQRYQSLKAQEQEMKQEGGQNRGHTHMNLPIYMQIEMVQGPKNNENQAFTEEKEEEKSDNNGKGLNNSLGAEQGLADLATPIMDTAMLACLEGTKVAEIQKKFFSSKNICLLCGNHVLRKFKGHIKDHMKEKKSIKSGYSFCLHTDGQSLQVKCNKCQKTFSKVTVKKLEEHNEACNSGKMIPNNGPLESMIDNGCERLEEEFEGKIKALKDQITHLDTRLEKTEVKVSGVFRTQESMKKKLNDTDKRVTGVEQNLKTVEEKVENHENVLMGLLKQLIGQGPQERPEEPMKKTNILARVKMSDKVKNESKEEERERERSRERARNGSQERRTARQVSERPEERKIRRRENSSEERSQDKRQTTRYDNKGRQLGQYKDSARRYE